MLDALSLLSMSHPEALQVMIQDSLLPGLSASYLQAANPVNHTDGTTTTGVFLAPVAYTDAGFPYRGQTAFTYHRMDFADMFGSLGLRLYTAPSIRTRHLVNMLERIFNIDIATGDYIDEPITHDNISPVNYLLRAKPTSNRWRGAVMIQVCPYESPMNIEDPDLNGIEPSTILTLPTDVLDGFVL